MKNKRKAFYIVDHMVYNGKPIKWYYTICGSWSDDKHRAKRFNEETVNVMLNNINSYRNDKNKAELEIQ